MNDNNCGNSNSNNNGTVVRTDGRARPTSYRPTGARPTGVRLTG